LQENLLKSKQVISNAEMPSHYLPLAISDNFEPVCRQTGKQVYLLNCKQAGPLATAGVFNLFCMQRVLEHICADNRAEFTAETVWELLTIVGVKRFFNQASNWLSISYLF